MELLTASLLRSRHGFPTREGGVSAGPFASLNSSFSVGDLEASVSENLARLATAAGVELSRMRSVTQVHGARVVEAAQASSDSEADALWTDVPGTAVGVRTADCVPILIEDDRGCVAAVHAGWRGVSSEIVSRTVEVMIAQGSKVSALRVAIGPCIQRCCFEVDGDLPDRFERAFGDEVLWRPGGKRKLHLDLPLAVKKSLARLGVPVDHVAALPQCTMCDARFFSHRREHGVTGRQFSFITCTGAACL